MEQRQVLIFLCIYHIVLACILFDYKAMVGEDQAQTDQEGPQAIAPNGQEGSYDKKVHHGDWKESSA